jgi:hypothetical protein
MAELELVTTHGTIALEQLKKQGIEIPSTVNISIPKLPADISELADEDLMILFSQYTAFWNFLSAQMACAIIDERTNEKDYSSTESLAMLRAHGGKSSKDTVTLLKAQVAADPAVKSASDKYEASYNYRKLVEMMVNNAERDTNLISRELTRRTSGSATKMRGSRMFA